MGLFGTLFPSWQTKLLKNEALREEMRDKKRFGREVRNLLDPMPVGEQFGARSVGEQLTPQTAADAAMMPQKRQAALLLPEERGPMLQGLLAEQAPLEMAKSLLPQPKKESRYQATIDMLSNMGIDLSPEEVKQMVGATADPSQEGLLDQMVPIEDLSKYRTLDANNELVPLKPMTQRDLIALAQSGQLISADKETLKDDKNYEGASGIIGMVNQTFAPLWENIPSGFGNRLDASAGAYWQTVTQDDPRYSTYEAFKDSVGATLAKAGGESGTLTDVDIERTMGLFPVVVPSPSSGFADSTETANLKMRLMEERFKLLAPKYKEATGRDLMQDIKKQVQVQMFPQSTEELLNELNGG